MIITILILVVIISTGYIIYINQPTSENNPQEKETNETKKLNIRLYSTNYKNFYPFVENHLRDVLKQTKYEPNFINHDDTEIDTEIEKNDLAVYVIYRANIRLEGVNNIEFLKKLKNKCNFIIIILRYGHNERPFDVKAFKTNNMTVIEYDIEKSKERYILYKKEKNSDSKTKLIEFIKSME